MKFDEEGLRIVLSGTLVAFLAVFAVSLWSIDLISQQRVFGAFLTAELVAFAMLVYTTTRRNYDSVKKAWILVGCVALVLLLSLSFF